MMQLDSCPRLTWSVCAATARGSLRPPRDPSTRSNSNPSGSLVLSARCFPLGATIPDLLWGCLPLRPMRLASRRVCLDLKDLEHRGPVLCAHPNQRSGPPPRWAFAASARPTSAIRNRAPSLRFPSAHLRVERLRQRRRALGPPRRGLENGSIQSRRQPKERQTETDRRAVSGHHRCASEKLSRTSVPNCRGSGPGPRRFLELPF